MIFTFVKTSPNELILNPLTRIACAYCSQFNTNWHCPPGGGLRLEVVEKLSKKYKLCYVVVFYFNIRERLETMLNKGINIGKAIALIHLQCESVARRKTRDVIQQFRKVGYVFSTGGSCRRCEVCNYELGKPCRYPEDLMFSPEASNILVYNILRKFNIPFEHPARNYVVKTSIILTNDVIDNDLVKQGCKAGFRYVDEVGKDVYKLLKIEKPLNINLALSNVENKFNVIDKVLLKDLVEDLYPRRCTSCIFNNMCKLLRVTPRDLVRFNEDTEVLIIEEKSNVSKSDLFHLWRGYASQNAITLLLSNNFKRYSSKYLVICSELLNVKLDHGKYAVVNIPLR